MCDFIFKEYGWNLDDIKNLTLLQLNAILKMIEVRNERIKQDSKK